MSLSTHALDAERGRPIALLEVNLLRHIPHEEDRATWPVHALRGRWQLEAGGRTDERGRLDFLYDLEQPGLYRLIFDTSREFYPEVVITFRVADPTEHYHIPLLLSSYSYTTYRGS